MALIGTLLLAGLLLLFLETLLPGMIAGIAGLICLGGAVVLGYTRFDPPVGHYILGGTLLALIIGGVLWIKYFPDSPAGRWFISTGQTGTVGAEKPELLNATGTAITALRPSGAAMIQSRRVDVVSEGAFIEKGQPIKVVAIEGLRVVVRAV
jgi:membrane-bound serine protease (ClpP class)